MLDKYMIRLLNSPMFGMVLLVPILDLDGFRAVGGGDYFAVQIEGFFGL